MSDVTYHAIALHSEKRNDLIGQIAYCEEKLNSQLEKWQRKEYVAVRDSAEKELEAVDKHLDYLATLK